MVKGAAWRRIVTTTVYICFPLWFLPQVDNCVSENKNNYFLGYAGLLVAASIIRVVEINFMMVGHTHMKIDQIFSR